jgi:lysophospholipase L1-like esterase
LSKGWRNSINYDKKQSNSIETDSGASGGPSMHMRGLTALFGCCFLCASVFADQGALNFDFVPDGNAAGHPAFDTARGFGFEPGADWKFSVQLPEGNYRVTLRFGRSRKPAHARVLAEQRRLMIENLEVGRTGLERSIIVNIRTAALAALPENATGGTRVALKPREIGSATWDDKLTIEIVGNASLRSVSIAPVRLPTLYLAGDSTVTDQGVAPNASWGQMLPAHFGPDIAIANHAESGETLKSFVTELRLDKLLSTVEPGDWVMIQFGHNDQKIQWPQTYVDAATTYRSWLRAYIAEVRRRGATPILVTSPERRNFDTAGHIVPSLGDYPDAVRNVAREERVALLDLNLASVRFYETLGPDAAPRAFADDGRDKTHHNEFGAHALAGLLIEALRAADPALTAGLAAHVVDSGPREKTR